MRYQAELLLVVAANPRRRGDLVGRLARAGHAVRETASVTAALALARMDPPSLIVLATDGTEPDLAAIGRRATAHTAAIPIIPPTEGDVWHAASWRHRSPPERERSAGCRRPP
jgi:DNA-binding response OmpR family regulator